MVLFHIVNLTKIFLDLLKMEECDTQYVLIHFIVSHITIVFYCEIENTLYYI